MLFDESEDDYEVDDDLLHQHQKDEIAFEDLCCDATFDGEGSTSLEVESWGFLDGHILARIFHFLQSDLKSLSFASVTCKHWRAAVSFYKDISRQVDLSSLGSNCTNSTFMNIMVSIISKACVVWGRLFNLRLTLLYVCDCRVLIIKKRSIL